MAPNGPRSEVFTTVLVNQKGMVADWALHFARMREHAKRLRIDLPDQEPLIGDAGNGRSWQLARVSCAGDGRWLVQTRDIRVRDEAVEAVSVEAKRWNKRTNGTKHGEWASYITARETAEARGCDVALLVHEHAIIDADRATPLVMDEDGTVWMAQVDDGGVDGITAGLLASHLPSLGLPVVKGKLNERTVARCAEMVVVGTGMGVCRVETLDGVTLGSSTALSSACQQFLSQHFTEETTWSTVGPSDV